MKAELTRPDPGEDQEFPSPAARVQQLRKWGPPIISSNVKRWFLPRDPGSWRVQLTTPLDLVSMLKQAKIFHYPHTFKQPVSIPGRGKNDHEDHPDSCSKERKGSFHEGKAAGPWSWPLNPIWCRSYEWVEIYLPPSLCLKYSGTSPYTVTLPYHKSTFHF
jgi:hypothetical protein